MVHNPFSIYSNDLPLFVGYEHLTTNEILRSGWTQTEDKDIILAAKAIFGIQVRATLHGEEKEAFLNLCMDLWEEAHGKSI